MTASMGDGGPQMLTPIAGERRRLSGTAVTSLVLGILLCLPLVTSLGAVLFAILGFRATRHGAKTGRGMAIAGLVLGLVGCLIWLAAGGFLWMLIAGSSAPRAMTQDFAKDLFGDHDIHAAHALCDASITESSLDELQKKLVPLGTYESMQTTHISLGSDSTGTRCELIGVITFSTGTRAFDSVLTKDASGRWKVLGFHVR